MDQEIKDILREARSKGATPEQLQRIADAYFESKKKNQGASGSKGPGTKTAYTDSPSRTGGVGLSTRPTLAAAAGKPEVQTPSESVRSGLKPIATRQLETGKAGEIDRPDYVADVYKRLEQNKDKYSADWAEKRKAADTKFFSSIARVPVGLATFAGSALDAATSFVTGEETDFFSGAPADLLNTINKEIDNSNRELFVSKGYNEEDYNKSFSELAAEGKVSQSLTKFGLASQDVFVDLFVGGRLGKLFPTVGGSSLAASRAPFVTQAVTNAVKGRAGSLVLAGSAGGSKIAELKQQQEEAGTYDQFDVFLRGASSAAIEFASEMLFHTSVDDLLANGLTKNFAKGMYESAKPMRKAIAGTASEVLEQGTKEGLEEVFVDIYDNVSDAIFEGKDILTKANAYGMLDAFLLGGAIGSGTSLLSYGPSSIGKASDIKARRSAIEDINSYMTDLASPDVNAVDKAVIRKAMNERLGELSLIQKRDADFYDTFSSEDQATVLAANQTIKMAELLLSKTDNKQAKQEIENAIRQAYSDKTKVENKYDPNIKVFEYAGTQVSGLPSTEQVGQTSVEGQPIQERGAKTPEASRILQALEQDETLGAITRGEEVIEDDANAAQERVLGLMDEVEGMDIPQQEKASLLEVLGQKFEDIEYYDNRATIDVETTTERRAVGAPRRVIKQKIGERSSTGFPRLRNYERLNNTEVSTGQETEGQVSVLEEQANGAVDLVTYTNGTESSRQPSVAPSLLDMEYVESVLDENGNLTGVVMRPKTAKGQEESPLRFTVNNKPELAMDIAIQAKIEQVGDIPQAEFEYAYEEVVVKKITKRKVEPKQRPAKQEAPKEAPKAKSTDVTTEELNRRVEEDPANADLYVAVSNAMKTLESVLPDAAIVFVDSNEEAAEYFKANDKYADENERGTDRGRFIKNKNTGRIEIVINTSKADDVTVYHELFHASFYAIYNQDPKKAIEFGQNLARILSTGNAAEQQIAKEVNAFISGYDSEDAAGVGEEFAAESAGILTANSMKLSPSMVNKIANFFNKIAKSMGLDPIFKKAASTKEVIDFMNSFSRAAKNGLALSENPRTSLLDNDVAPGDVQDDVVVEFFSRSSKGDRYSYTDKFGNNYSYIADSEEFQGLVDQGYVSFGHSMEEFQDVPLMVHVPDNNFTGIISRTDKDGNAEILVKGKGGVFYPIHFHELGYFWASTDGAANTMAKNLNKISEVGDGVIRLVLVSSQKDKLLSTTSSNQALLDLLSSKVAKNNFKFNKTQFKESIKFAFDDFVSTIVDKDGNAKSKYKYKRAPKKLPANASLEQFIAEYERFIQQDNSSFNERKTLAQSLLDGVVNAVGNNKEAAAQFRELLGIKTQGGKISKSSLSEGFSELFTEPMLKGVKEGLVYAVVEIDGKVISQKTEGDENTHESYGSTIRSESGNRARVKLLKNPTNAFESVYDANKGRVFGFDGTEAQRKLSLDTFLPTNSGISQIVVLKPSAETKDRLEKEFTISKKNKDKYLGEGSDLRYGKQPKLQKKGVGSRSQKAPSKNIGGEKYFHYNYIGQHIALNDGVLNQSNFNRAESVVANLLDNLGVKIKFNTLKYNPKSRVITFQEGIGFDKMREPVVGHSIGVNLETGNIVSGTKADGKLRAPSQAIWHNKWQWVDDSYKGFNVADAKKWSETWGSKFATGERTDIGKKENWDRKLTEKGLPVEGEVQSRSQIKAEKIAPNVQVVINPTTGVEHTVELPMSSGGTSIPQKNHVVTDYIANGKKSPQRPFEITSFASIGAGKKMFNGKPSPSHEMMRERLPNAQIFLLDPENIAPEENLQELVSLFSQPADAAEAANVLNVIPDAGMRNSVIKSVYDVLGDGGWAYFKIFVGSKQNKTLLDAYKEGSLAYGNNPEMNEELYATNKQQGISDDSFYYSRQTGKDKMQVNQRAPFYQPEIEAVFGDKGFVDNDIIIVQKKVSEPVSRSQKENEYGIIERERDGTKYSAIKLRDLRTHFSDGLEGFNAYFNEARTDKRVGTIGDDVYITNENIKNAIAFIHKKIPNVRNVDFILKSLEGLENVSKAMEDAVPRPTLSREELVNSIKNSKGYNAKQKELMLDFVSKVKSDKFFNLITPKGVKRTEFGQTNYYTYATNVLFLTRPSAFAHEVSHWGFYNLLSPQERVEYYKYFYERFKDDRYGEKRADELAKGRRMNFVDENGDTIGVTTNAMDGPQEYFANQFEQWYFNNVDVDKKIIPLYNKIGNYVRAVIQKFKEFGFNKDLTQNFEKIVDLKREAASRSRIDSQQIKDNVDESVLWFRTKFQDKLARVIKIQEDVEAYVGGGVDLKYDFKNAEARLSGAVETAGNKTLAKAEEIVKLFTSAGLNVEQFNDLLYAMHALERNARKRVQTTDISSSLNELRGMFDMTPTEVANIAGLDVDTYRQIESTGNVTEAELKSVLDVYGMTEGEFYNTYAANKSGSGMTDIDAIDILSKYPGLSLIDPLPSQLKGNLRKAVEMVYEINRETRNLWVSSGLESKEKVDNFEMSYNNYVPLIGFASDPEEESFVEGGTRLSVVGRTKKALGRYSKADSPFTQAIVQNVSAITRGSKNLAVQKLYNLVDDNKDDNLYEVIDPAVNPKYKNAENNGKIVRVPMTESDYLSKPKEYVPVRFGGKYRFISFADERLNTAMNGMNNQEIGLVTGALKTVNGWMSAFITRYDPEFVFRNFARDIQSAVFNAMAEQELTDGLANGEKIVANVMKGVYPSFKTIVQFNRGGKPTGEYANYYNEFLEYGGQIGGFFGQGSKAVDEKVVDFFNKASKNKGNGLADMPVDAVKYLGKSIDDVNNAVENAVRLSAFIAARKAKISPEKAAELSKGLTVNFNKSGEYGQVGNAAFLFFNASIQGSMRMLRTFKPNYVETASGKKLKVTMAQKFALGLVGLGALIALFNAGTSGDDEEDGKSWYSKIPDYEKDRNLIIMNPFDKKGKDYFKIPLPYGYNLFYILGNTIADVNLGVSTTSEGISNILMSIITNFSPTGMPGGEDLNEKILNFITPSVLRPITEISINKDFLGRPIYSEQLDFTKGPIPDSESGKRAGAVATNLAKLMNQATGGTEFTPGKVDVNPDVLEYIFGYYAGGTGKTITRSSKLIEKGISGELSEVKPNEIPLARVFYGSSFEGADYSQYWDRLNTIYRLSKDAEVGNITPAEAKRVDFTFKKLKETEKMLRNIRKVEKALDEKKSTDKERYKELDKKKGEYIKGFFSTYEKNNIDDI